MESFIGIVLSMGLNHKSILKDYWSNSKLFEIAGIKDLF